MNVSWFASHSLFSLVITQPVVRWTRWPAWCGGWERHPRQVLRACLIYQRFESTRKFPWKYLDSGHIFSLRHWLNKTGPSLWAKMKSLGRMKVSRYLLRSSICGPWDRHLWVLALSLYMALRFFRTGGWLCIHALVKLNDGSCFPLLLLPCSVFSTGPPILNSRCEAFAESSPALSLP